MMMKETLGARKIKISGFGNFVLARQTTAPGRNPQNRGSIKDQRAARAHLQGEPILKQALNARDADPQRRRSARGLFRSPGRTPV